MHLDAALEHLVDRALPGGGKELFALFGGKISVQPDFHIDVLTELVTIFSAMVHLLVFRSILTI